jgi:hypothetical protein
MTCGFYGIREKGINAHIGIECGHGAYPTAREPVVQPEQIAGPVAFFRLLQPLLCSTVDNVQDEFDVEMLAHVSAAPFPPEKNFFV